MDKLKTSSYNFVSSLDIINSNRTGIIIEQTSGYDVYLLNTWAYKRYHKLIGQLYKRTRIFNRILNIILILISWVGILALTAIFSFLIPSGGAVLIGVLDGELMIISYLCLIGAEFIKTKHKGKAL